MLQVYETALTIQTYAYRSALQETEPNDPIYPYPRLDPDRVGPPEPRDYHAVVLENDFVAVTLLPELGGRVYRWVDKATGQRLLYENPVIKPTGWGYRGWWLAAGGIEWAFPVEEHGLNEWRPWKYAIRRTEDSAAVTVWDVESRTGMEVGATVTLHRDHAAMTLRPWATNPTDAAQPYQYWLNAMLALGGNRISDATRFVIPADQVIVHSTGDDSLPDAWARMSWPVYGGRDLSRYSTWTSYLGFFIPQLKAGFIGIYDGAADQGVVRTLEPGWPVGNKIFGPGTLPSWLWTDDESTYVELWSGATPTFADLYTLEPDQTVSWTEWWYPVHGLGGLTSATLDAALHLNPVESGVEIGVGVTQRMQGQVTLFAEGATAASWEVALAPNQGFHTTWAKASGHSAPWGLRLMSAKGQNLAETGHIPEQ